MEQNLESHSRVGRDARIQRVFTLAIVVVLVLVIPASTYADGIDIVWLITRVGGGSLHPAFELAIVVGLMTVNYLLNLVVLGITAARFLKIKLRALAKDLAAFTLLAQIADRASAVGGFLLGSSIIDLADIRGEQSVVAAVFVGVCLNFIFAGLSVGALALWYLIRRWGVKRRRAIAIAVLTAVITNPAWPMMINWLYIQWLISRSGPLTGCSIGNSVSRKDAKTRKDAKRLNHDEPALLAVII